MKFRGWEPARASRNGTMKPQGTQANAEYPSSVQCLDFDTSQAVQPQCLCRTTGEIDQTPVDERSAIVHHENDRPTVAKIGDPDPRRQGKGSVRCAQTMGVETGPHRCTPAGLLSVPGCNAPLPISLGTGQGTINPALDTIGPIVSGTLANRETRRCFGSRHGLAMIDMSRTTRQEDHGPQTETNAAQQRPSERVPESKEISRDSHHHRFETQDWQESSRHRGADFRW